jgi:hypothetical protein
VLVTQMRLKKSIDNSRLRCPVWQMIRREWSPMDTDYIGSCSQDTGAPTRSDLPCDVQLQRVLQTIRMNRRKPANHETRPLAADRADDAFGNAGIVSHGGPRALARRSGSKRVVSTSAGRALSECWSLKRAMPDITGQFGVRSTAVRASRTRHIVCRHLHDTISCGVLGPERQSSKHSQ